MAHTHSCILGALIALTSALQAQKLDDAEVRITYGDLKQLLARGDAADESASKTLPPPALVAARLRLSIERNQPVIDATFRTFGFGQPSGRVPLISGDVSLESQSPETAVVIVDDDSLCLVTSTAGTETLQLRLLPVHTNEGFSFTIPPCPSLLLETGEFTSGQSLVLDAGAGEEILTAGAIRPLSNKGEIIKIRLLDTQETQKALSPPEPSSWTWQHQAMVAPEGGDLTYHIMARASATNGSGVEATLALPADARDIVVMGEDLVGKQINRGTDRSQNISLVWKTRGILDRQLIVSYRMPLRPLDRTWKLQAPGDQTTRTRFFIAMKPMFEYSAGGLSSPLAPQALPSPLAEFHDGSTFQQLEAGNAADLTVTPVPVASTEEGMVKQAEWMMKIEPDGSMLATGQWIIEHKGPLSFIFDTPEDMKLLSCELAGRPINPIDLGNGKLKVALAAESGNSQLTCSFTRSGPPLDPVEGTLKVALPQTPLFLHSLLWHLELPSGFQAETHGNLTRITSTNGAPSRISLRKNLCRDERPEVQIFYQRADLNR